MFSTQSEIGVFYMRGDGCFLHEGSMGVFYTRGDNCLGCFLHEERWVFSP